MVQLLLEERGQDSRRERRLTPVTLAGNRDFSLFHNRFGL
jgi:hypothetical protein